MNRANKILFSLAVSVLASQSSYADADENSFPADGNVGVGTASPPFPLVIDAVPGTNHTLNVRGDPATFGWPASLAGPILQGVSSNNGSWEPITIAGSSINLMFGNVGVGTITPAATLDVNGGIRAGSSTTVTVCNSSTEGTQRYNYSSHNMEFCNGTSWTAMCVP